MIYFKTRNSVYEVRVLNGQFAVTKIREINASPFNEMYQTRVSPMCYIEVGRPADFGSWHTSTVLELLAERPSLDVDDREDDTRL